MGGASAAMPVALASGCPLNSAQKSSLFCVITAITFHSPGLARCITSIRASFFTLVILMKKILAFTAVLFGCSAMAQELPGSAFEGARLQPIKFDEFISEARDKNSWVLNKRLSIEVAVAYQGPMSAFNINPSVSYTRGTFYQKAPAESFRTPQSNTFTLSGTIEGFGKRKARSDSAAAEVGRQAAELDAMLSGVEVDGAYLFLDALRVKLLWQTSQNSIDYLSRLPAADSAQAVADYKKAQTDLINDFRYFSLAMASYMGRKSIEFLPEPKSDFLIVPQDFDLKKLIAEAGKSRTDLLTLEAALKLAEANQTLAKKNRNLDISASVYNTRSPAYDSSGTTYERGSSYGFSLSVPIPIAQIYDADLVQAANNRMQLQISLEEARNKVQFEVNQAFLQFNSAKSKLANAMQERKGGAKSNFKSAQEVIDVHNSDAELIDAKINYAKALVYLGKVAGLKKPLPL